MLLPLLKAYYLDNLLENKLELVVLGLVIATVHGRALQLGSHGSLNDSLVEL